MDRVSKETRSYIMSRIRSESLIEEVPAGFRCLRLRRHPSGIFGKPDFGNKFRRIALFIDGDFWHGNPRTFKLPKTNAKFWKEKIHRNRVRDALVNRKLKASGWTVIRVWESDL